MRAKKSKPDTRSRALLGGTWTIRHSRYFCAARCGGAKATVRCEHYGFRTVQSGCRLSVKA